MAREEIKILICKSKADKDAGIGKEFIINADVDDFGDIMGIDTVRKDQRYGFRVRMQKEECKDRNWEDGVKYLDGLVEKAKAVKCEFSYTVRDWVKGASSTISADDKALLAMFRGMSNAQIAELVATHKALKVA